MKNMVAVSLINILLKTGYLCKLQPQDVVLADKGCNVEDSIAFRGATLNIPAFTRGQSACC